MNPPPTFITINLNYIIKHQKLNRNFVFIFPDIAKRIFSKQKLNHFFSSAEIRKRSQAYIFLNLSVIGF